MATRFSYLFLFYAAVDVYSKLQRVEASIRRLMEISESEPSVKENTCAVNLVNNGPGSIGIRELSFGYADDRLVLKKLDLEIRAGERVALVGASGKGKSTLAQLLVRLCDPSQGWVVVNGIDVRDVKLKSLRSSLVLVPQEPVLFDLTLRENLLHGNKHANEADLREVIRISQLDEVVDKWPSGWDETLGARGGKLSGGERQRVALARALLQRPSILVLDESTSALDHSTEYRLFRSLDQYLQNVTVIIISHREFPLKWADRTVCLEEYNPT